VTGVLAASDYMERALFLAERGRGRTSPNPMVGAVIVSRDGIVVGQGFHERAGEAHAEVRALDMAGGRARGATLYCTLEPCCHVGRTGPCTERIVAAGIARVVAAVEDPNPLVRGRGFQMLRERGIEVDVGLGAGAASRINGPFFTLTRDGRPFVVLKAAVSRDWKIAARAGAPTRLTSPASDRHAHRVRAEVDAIGIGSGTLLADDPLLTARGAYRERPLIRVIFDRRLRTPPTARVLSTLEAGPVIIVTSTAAAATERARLLAGRGVEIEPAGTPTFRGALDRLAKRGIESLLLEGGAAVHRAAWDEGLVDFVRLYVAPLELGPGAVPFGIARVSLEGLQNRRVSSIGDDELIEGYVHGAY